jgi:hypothetical protein
MEANITRARCNRRAPGSSRRRKSRHDAKQKQEMKDYLLAMMNTQQKETNSFGNQ